MSTASNVVVSTGNLEKKMTCLYFRRQGDAGRGVRRGVRNGRDSRERGRGKERREWELQLWSGRVGKRETVL